MQDLPAFGVIRLLVDRGAEICCDDPHAEGITIDGGQSCQSARIDAGVVRWAGPVILITDHSVHGCRLVVTHVNRALDTRNATRGVEGGRQKVVRL